MNTGWTGGAYGTGKRMPIAATRALLTAALNGSLNNVEFRERSELRLRGAGGCAWRRRETARSTLDLGRCGRVRRAGGKLVAMFAANFAQYEAHVSDEVKASAIG